MAGVLGARTGAFGRATYFEITEPVAEHAHPHVHMLFKLGGGDRRVLVEGTTADVTDTQCMLINPWQKHADVGEQPAGPTLMLVLYLDAEWIAARLGVYAVGFDALAGAVTPAMLERARRIAAALSGESVDDETFEEMIGALAADAAPDHLVDRRTGLADYRIRHALRKLREHPHLHIDYRDVARDVGLSRSRFYEQFRSSVGVAPNMFVDGLVLEQAYSLMSDSDRPLDEIASRLGFSAQSSFTRFFRDRVGFPPSTLRRQIERN
jgi:AraC-like DNA-binding protein